MKYSPVSKANRKKLDIALAAFISAFCLAASAQAQTVYFDPNDTHTAAGGDGEFNGATSWESGGVNGPFASGDSAYFDGAAGTVTVNAPVSAKYLEVGVTSGTETIGSGVDASQVTLGPVLLNQGQTLFKVDAGSENMVFNSNVNLLLEGQTYGDEVAGTSASTGNVTFNGGITFTDNVTLATDPANNSTGSPGLDLVATAPGGTFTLNSSVRLVTDPGAEPTQNGNAPNLYFTGSSASNTLTLTSNAKFIDTRIDADGGTVLDDGAQFTILPGGESTNGPILIGNGGQYLAGLANMTISDSVQFVGGGGSLGSDVVGVTTFSGTNSYNNSLVAISYSGSAPVNLVAGAGSRVNILGDVVNGNGYGINKTGVGTVNIDDGYNVRIQGGGWDVQNGTLLVNSNGTIVNGTIPGGGAIGLTIDNVATSSLSSSQTYATLGGNASVSALVTAAGANSAITPGDPTVNNGIGTLTLNGGLTATSGLTLNFVLDGEGNAVGVDSSRLIVPDLTLSGPVTVNFSTVDTIETGVYYTVIDANNESASWNVSGANFTFNAPAGYAVDNYKLSTTGDTFSVEFDAVPEPSTWALMGLGVVLVVGAARFRKQQA
jgi:fibronectin-binding autotransporter adhesin